MSLIALLLSHGSDLVVKNSVKKYLTFCKNVTWTVLISVDELRNLFGPKISTK